MPARNAIKIYVEDGYYHLYNRGVERRQIFLDAQDYDVFLGYLAEYLSYKDEKRLSKALASDNLSSIERQKLNRKLQIGNYSSKITLLAFCLKPNHFHLFVKQSTSDAINRFMRSLSTRYSTYFNRKYKRGGALYQGVYKAVLIDDEAQYLHISRYIHKQAIRSSLVDDTEERLSSYPEYLGIRKTPWIHTEEILSFFSKTEPSLTYKRFVEEYDPLEELEEIEPII
jgi:putative transposase